MISILIEMLGNKTVRLIVGLFLSLFLIGGIIAYLTHRARKAERETKKAQEEANRLQMQTEGLKILNNTANLAAEIEKRKELANVKEANSKTANNNYNDLRRRDSQQSSNSAADAGKKFCAEFPEDSLCR